MINIVFKKLNWLPYIVLRIAAARFFPELHLVCLTVAAFEPSVACGQCWDGTTLGFMIGGFHVRHHFGVGAPPILVYFSGDWDVRWGYDLDFDPWPYLCPLLTLVHVWISKCARCRSR